jgi:hypothetical protein
MDYRESNMSPPAKKYLTRNDLARMLEISIRAVKSNEVALGIAPARVDMNSRTIRYHADQAIKALKESGNLPKD